MEKKKIDWLNHSISLIVVFLGVTAGFILQNQKDNASDRDLEKKYISSFINDIDNNIEELKNLIENDSLWLGNNMYSAVYIMGDTLSYDSACSLIKSMVYFSEFSEQTDTYEDISGSGNLNLIKDFEMKNEIIAYHKSLKDYGFLERYSQEYYSTNFLPFIMNNFDLFTNIIIPKEIYKTVKFKNVVGGFISYTQQRIFAHKELLEESYNLKALLENY